MRYSATFVLSSFLFMGCYSDTLLRTDAANELLSLREEEVTSSYNNSGSAFPFPKDFLDIISQDEQNQMPSEMSELLPH